MHVLKLIDDHQFTHLTWDVERVNKTRSKNINTLGGVDYYKVVM